MARLSNILRISRTLFLLFIVLATIPSRAQQPESPVACVEGTEPLALVYGDHTTGCAISGATDLDRFEFCGLASDEVRLNVNSAGNFMDPDVVIRDPTAAIIAGQSCNDSCTLTIDIVLPVDGCYTVFVEDVGTNNTGDYQLQVERIVPASDLSVAVSYDVPQSDVIMPATDIDFFTFSATTGTQVRLNVLSSSSFMDPTVEIRDPAGTLVVNGLIDGASCNDGCSFSIEFTPAVSGEYSLIVYDLATNNTGSYEFNLVCLDGPCGGTSTAVSYDVPQSDVIVPATDVDFFTFSATTGTQIRLNMLSPSSFMDPTVEIRDPAGTLVVNGLIDGASCNNGCSFSIDFTPAVSGEYSLIVYDLATNNTGSYEFNLVCLDGPCDGIPDPTGPLLSYVTPRLDTIVPAVDVDYFRFHGTVGTLVQLNVLTASSFLDPTVEIRDPAGNLVIDGVNDGATCNNGCSFSSELSPAMTGFYTVMIYDLSTNNTGEYDISMWCLDGPCDSDGDGLLDGNPPVSLATPSVLQYGIAANDEIVPEVDSDMFIFGGTAGDLIRVNVLSTSSFMDPTIQIRDPNGVLIIDGVTDGASCNNGCSFSVDVSPTVTGTYALNIFDLATNNTGNYEISVQCLIGTCTNGLAVCFDNCIDAANGPAIPDAGGNVQRDTDGDGFGNACDPDLDNNNVVNFLDLSLWSDEFLSSNPDADFDGSGVVNFSDLFIFAELFLSPPGPSCPMP